jgi:F-type H+-transporting ATPase subunit epsilon
MIVRREGQNKYRAVGEGLVAVAAANIDEARAEEARQRAAARLRERLSSEEVASVNAALARSLAQLNVERRGHK